jgi:dihydroxyacetone kinase-like protein
MSSPRRRLIPIIECAKAVDSGAGVLFMYGNYAGDVMNFDMAAEMLAMDDIEVRTVVTTDDVASAPRDQARQPGGVSPATSSSSRRQVPPAT